MARLGHSLLWFSCCLIITGSIRAQEMVTVPAGTFLMGSDRSEPDERPAHRVRLEAFLIDRHEVSQDQYARCVTAGICRPPRRYPDLQDPRLPVVGVSWLDARTYCRWEGKRLPTEAQWERAARGTDGRRFPWGGKLDCSRGNFGNFAGAGPCAGKNPGKILPVGSRPKGASPAGAQDMAGNVWEWVADSHPGYSHGRQEGKGRVVRGGSCCSYFAMPTTTNRLWFPPDYRDNDVGFRCAMQRMRHAAH